jgi:hypothetical protein
VRVIFLLILAAGFAHGQPDWIFSGSRDHPAINYDLGALQDPVVRLNARLRSREVALKFDGARGYLDSVLDALGVFPESQLAVFSKTSLQQAIIGPANPRMIYFNDSTAVAWVRGEPFVEVATQDPLQGVHFYTLDQRHSDAPAFMSPEFVRKDGVCITCHESYGSLGVPGTLLRSVYPDARGRTVRSLGEFNEDHRTPFEHRWGGWFVADTGALKHLGNSVFSEDESRSVIESPIESKLQSDPAARMVFGHQMRMMNLSTTLGWEARIAAYEKKPLNLDGVAKEFVDYLLFLDEPRLPVPIGSGSAFAKKFSAQAPSDRRGRSLRQLDLNTRLLRYPCSYMIYSEAFNALPPEAKTAVYRRMWRLLSGEERTRLSREDRTAIIEILQDTKKDFGDVVAGARGSLQQRDR